MEKYQVQYESFKRETIEKGAEYCWDNSYKIGFYINIYDIIDSLYEADWDIVRDLANLIEDGSIDIEGLWDDFIDNDWASYNNWETFLDFINEEVDCYKKKPMPTE